MPMLHRTQIQAIKRRFTGEEGRERSREFQQILGDLPNYKARTTAQAHDMNCVAEQALALKDRTVQALPSAAPGAAPRASSPDGLTAREGDVLRLLARGLSNKEMAAALVVSVRTVDNHSARLYDKVGAHNRAQATAYALRHGLT